MKSIEQFIIEKGSDDLNTFGGDFEGGIHLQQVPDEIAACIEMIMKSKEDIRSYLEIGVAAGGTTYLFNHFFNLEKIVLVDDNRHHKAKLRATILQDVSRFEFIGRSDEERIINATTERAPFDIVMVDGDHSYKGVGFDVNTYLPFLRTGGFLILHDSAIPEWGVMQATNELKDDDSLEFIDEYLTKQGIRPLGLAVFKKVI